MIGGGDWAADRLVPDIDARAVLAGEPCVIRNPERDPALAARARAAARATCMLAERLWRRRRRVTPRAGTSGPDDGGRRPGRSDRRYMIAALWGERRALGARTRARIRTRRTACSSTARRRAHALGWRPRLTLERRAGVDRGVVQGRTRRRADVRALCQRADRPLYASSARAR